MRGLSLALGDTAERSCVTTWLIEVNERRIYELDGRGLESLCNWFVGRYTRF